MGKARRRREGGRLGGVPEVRVLCTAYSALVGYSVQYSSSGVPVGSRRKRPKPEDTPGIVRSFQGFVWQWIHGGTGSRSRRRFADHVPDSCILAGSSRRRCGGRGALGAPPSFFTHWSCPVPSVTWPSTVSGSWDLSPASTSLSNPTPADENTSTVGSQGCRRFMPPLFVPHSVLSHLPIGLGRV